MIPITQEQFENADRTQAGDCFCACLASILELPLRDVPRFFEGAAAGTPLTRAMEDHIQQWFARKGLTLMFLPIMARSTGQALTVFGGRYPTLYYVLVGQTKKGVNHAVVCCGTAIVHDPAGRVASLYGPQEDGFFTVCIIAFSQPI